MKQTSFQTLKTSDRVAVDAFEQIAAVEGLTATTATFTFLHEDTLEIPVGEIAQHEQLQALLANDVRIFRSIRYSFQNNRAITLARRDDADGGKTASLWDIVRVNPGSPQEDQDSLGFAKLLGAAQTHFQQASLSAVSVVFGPDVQKHFEAREQALNRLESIADRMLRDIDERRRQLDDDFAARTKKLEDQLAVRENSLNETHSKRLGELDEKDTELDARAKELDDKEAKHARRQVYRELKDKFQEWGRKFQVSEGTSKKRWIVHIFAVTLMLVAAAVVCQQLWLTIKTPPTTGVELANAWITKAVFTLLFVTSAIFYTKWNTQWFQRHANEEFRLKRMELDLDRASWFVELSFQWKDENGEVIPESLANRLTQHLFAVDVDDLPAEHPADVLTSGLLKLKATRGGAEVSIDGRDKGRVTKRVASSK